jgi:hypothetical protein
MCMHRLRLRAEVCSFLLSLFALAPLSRATAQVARSSLPPLELRVDAINVRSINTGTLQGGVGANVPLGVYVRLELVGAGGITRVDSVNHNSARVDAIARFLLDPFNEATWGLSIGGGMSAMFEATATTHEYLVVVADLEAPRIGAVAPALQIGLGGGVRVGIVLRAFRTGRR